MKLMRVQSARETMIPLMSVKSDTRFVPFPLISYQTYAYEFSRCQQFRRILKGFISYLSSKYSTLNSFEMKF